MEDRELKGYVPEMARTALEGFEAGFTVFAFITYALKWIFNSGTIFTILKSRTPPLEGTFGFSRL